jgi:two-component system cell cycle response regulator DivK
MAHEFNGHTFGQFIGDLKSLLASSREYERELMSLEGFLQNDGAGVQVSAAGVSVATTTQVSAPIQLGLASALVEAIARLQLAAGEQRQSVETMLTRLIGDHAVDDATHARSRILIVDDSDSNRETTAAILEDAGFDVITATNGLEGVIVAHYVRPSVILMDLTMPVLNGLEAARLIRASTATKDLKVIAYTARPDLYDSAVRKWFVDVILKPATADAIVALVRRVAAADATRI